LRAPRLHERRIVDLARATLAALASLTAGASSAAAAPPALDYRVTVEQHFDPPPAAHWFQARAVAYPDGSALAAARRPPRILLTLQPHGSEGTHTYLGIASALSRDLGATWRGPVMQPALDLHPLRGSIYEVPVDATPIWHAATGKVLLVGATFQVDREIKKDVPRGPSDVFYAVFDPRAETWSTWKKLAPSRDFEWPYKRAGCVQAVVEADGRILLPIYFGDHNNSVHLTTVVRCSFDGQTLRWLEQGDDLVINFGRGYSEPSLAKFDGRYFLTLRNNRAGYVTSGPDGLKFDPPQLWRFDDGEPLGSYNTQQHWMTHSEGLFLVYTRRGVDNDDVMRHRAPLLMARVDPRTLRVIRASERIVIPKAGKAAMGNFGVCDVTPDESWIVIGLRPDTKVPAKNVFIGRVQWSRPNALATVSPR
jgi:hypothetical protein